MASALHLCPDRLRTHAAAADVLAAELRAGAGPPGGAPDAAGLRVAVLRAASELTQLSAALSAAAISAEQSDAATARSLGRMLRTR